jgi:2-polyprenyl-3-methyl-5-hydroxy-6-metoxy-1,4-benzoquinol methylase
MTMTAVSKQPSAELFFSTLQAYQRTAALKAAVELELFTKIGEGAHTAPALAQKCEASERGTRILCDFLVVCGFLTKQGNSYGLTLDSATFLDRRSPAYLASAVNFMTSPMMTENYKDLTAVVRKGGPVINTQGTIAPEHPVWIEFARSMAPLQNMPSELMANLLRADSGAKCKVLDIAAGHGLFGIAVARHNPNAEIVAVDWPNVLEVAKENAQAAGVGSRHRLLPGSAFDVEYGSGYDLVLLTNFLHHFDVPTNEQLLRKVHAALAPGGRAAALELVPNEDRVSPETPAAFSMMMLGSTPAGDAYPFSEFERMFRNAGFSRCELHPLPPTFEQVIVAFK